MVEMKVEEHIKALEEHERKLKECIEEGLGENQRNIGYNASQASVELFSIYMHKLNLVTSGEMFDHRIFKKGSMIDERIPQEFPKKEEVMKLMGAIERKRNILCYGKRKPEDEIKYVIKALNRLREVIGDMNDSK